MPLRALHHSTPHNTAPAPEPAPQLTTRHRPTARSTNNEQHRRAQAARNSTKAEQREDAAQKGAARRWSSTEGRRTKMEGHEDGAAVHLGQLRGSHAIAQLSDICIGMSVDRNDPNADVRNLHVLKNRYTGETGFAGTLQYIREASRLLDEINPFIETQGAEDAETKTA